MYRPTVKYHDVYKRYVDQVSQVTSLDRNQIIRLALFTTTEESTSLDLEESSLAFDDDPHLKTNERTYELKWRLTSSEKEIMILVAIFGFAAIVF
ncbi:hypothetical protein [Tuberibacillus sp. Marseille-P3662]|uniref:hypothetical protein n=1 Tax=Tuberibacillus sp. Marseille-P3662 TaxID=1965358 RepID=UPI000A1CD9F4|nr:hypothetical protein [Tuberibacillus sp. Marseille-P3662]